MSLLTRPRSIPKLTRMTVTLYTRAQCCCCRSALETLQEYQDQHGFVLEEVDASDPSLVERIGPTVPVIAVDGKVRFRGEVNRVLFERLLEASTSGR
jgi:glutaredoxin